MCSCHSRDGRCVRDVVKAIVKAQNEVAARNHGCNVSCERSIRELLSPAQNGNGDTTIPFVLYCKDCKPFVASGVKHVNGTIHCIESPVFKAKKFVDGSSHCVKLELLKAERQAPCDSHKNKGNVCHFIDGATGFKSTGICITVDLDCFCGISCLGTTTPTRLTEADL
ncbi:CotY/CotZ family spore coat protein [Halobacillus litoralis]|uniref:CotY/CotZ family spore coat protein n=1 Tax=Halobacillus litoralis TaxID=45668 RepID=UPI001CFDF1CB|nr:CotY/CotZ family spore coat protein [Halobacillus litoralis]